MGKRRNDTMEDNSPYIVTPLSVSENIYHVAQNALSDHGLHGHIKVKLKSELTSHANSSSPEKMQQKVAPDLRNNFSLSMNDH